MSIDAYLRTHQLVIRDECLKESPGTESTNRFLFGRAVTKGQLVAIGVICGTRKRLYLSRAGEFDGSGPDLGSVARILASGGPLGCQSALEAWAGLPVGGINPVVAYIHAPERPVVWKVRLGDADINVVRDYRDRECVRSGDDYLVSAEQSLVDSLDDRNAFSAGWSVLKLLPHIRLSVEKTIELASRSPKSTQGRVGFALEHSGRDLSKHDWRILNEAAERLRNVGSGARVGVRGRSMSERWHVLVPGEEASHSPVISSGGQDGTLSEKSQRSRV